MIIPGEKNKIKKEIDKAREEKGPLTADQKRKIARRVHKKMKRNFKTAIILGALGITAIGANKLLDAPKQSDKTFEQEANNIEEKNINTREEFVNKIKVDSEYLENTSEVEEEKEENKIFEQIVEKFNSKYPESPISEGDLGIIETEPPFLTEQTNEDGTITYIENYKTQADQLEANQEYVYDKACRNYVVVNKKDNTIILSQGIVDFHVVDIDTRTVKVGYQEYVLSEKNITLGESEAEKTIVYQDLKDKFNEIVKEKQMAEQKNEKDYEIDD